jgi:hypothetical protein
MRIWVDADACPVVIKDILFRAAERKGIQLILVANRAVSIPASPWISSLRVTSGSNIADKEIVNRLGRGDLVITADIPLAAEVIAKGGFALNPRGEMYDADSIDSRLSVRDFMDSLRASGVDTGGPSALKQSDRKAFADQLDAFLAKMNRT